MRRIQDQHEEDFTQAIAMGKENQKCIQHMSQWCAKAEIDRTSEGLYAQFTGLPIATHRISCSEVPVSSEGMNLRSLFSHYLIEHCSTCKKHEPNGDTCWGQQVISKHRIKEKKRKSRKKQEAERLEAERARLRLQSRSIVATADHQSQSVIAYLQEIFSDDSGMRESAARKLTQSVTLAPDLIPNDAICLILALGRSADFASLILPACEALAAKRTDLDDELTSLALDNISNSTTVSLSARVIYTLEHRFDFPLEKRYIERLIFSMDHFVENIVLGNELNPHEHVMEILLRSYDSDKTDLIAVFERSLREQNDTVRSLICSVIFYIQRKRPEVVESLIPVLIESLDLSEEQYMEHPPSRQVIRILNAGYFHDPKMVDSFIASSIKNTRPAVQSDLIEVYHIGRGSRWYTEPNWTTDHIDIAISRLLSWGKDNSLDLSVRTECLNALKDVLSQAHEHHLEHLENLFGYFALIAPTDNPPKRLKSPQIVLPGQPNRAEQPQLQALELLTAAQEWESFKKSLHSCLEAMCEIIPEESFDLLSAVFEHPRQQHESELRCASIDLLGGLGRHYRLRSKILPLLWKCLMDYDSPVSRAAALRASIEIFPSRAQPPDNLPAIVVLQLLDPDPDVGRAALLVVSRKLHWFSRSRCREVLAAFEVMLRSYSSSGYLTGEISKTALSIAARCEDLKSSVLKMVDEVLPTGERWLDREITERLTRTFVPSDSLAEGVARHVLYYLKQYERDRHNNYRFSTRREFFDWLHGISSSTYQQIAGDIMNAALYRANQDPIETLHFASLTAHFRDFESEIRILQATIQATPLQARYKSRHELLTAMHESAHSNALLKDQL